MNIILRVLILSIPFIATSCGGSLFVNGETSIISNVDPFRYCLKKNAWDSLQELYPINDVTDPEFKSAIAKMNNHWVPIKYILYFKDEPEELIACEYYGIRVVYNPKLSADVLTGLDPELSDEEQVRVRNRVLNALYGYACTEGKIKLQDDMKEPAVFSEEYYDKQKKWYNIF